MHPKSEREKVNEKETPPATAAGAPSHPLRSEQQQRQKIKAQNLRLAEEWESYREAAVGMPPGYVESIVQKAERGEPLRNAELAAVLSCEEYIREIVWLKEQERERKLKLREMDAQIELPSPMAKEKKREGDRQAKSVGAIA